MPAFTLKLLATMKFNNQSMAALLLAVFVSLFAAQSCKKDDPPVNNDPPCNMPNADLSYTKNIKGIIDNICLNCHSGAGPGPDDYRTYEGLKSHLDDGHVLDRVVIKKDMPQSGVTMRQSQRDSINCWIKAGYPK